jgi:hypothetical protein
MDAHSFLPRIDHHGVLLEPTERTVDLEAFFVGVGRAGRVWVEAEDDVDEESRWMDVMFHDAVSFGGKIYKVGDVVYATPEATGEHAEIGRIEQIYDNLCGTEDNIGITYRFLWRQEQIILKKKDEKLFCKNEIFWSDVIDNEQGVDSIEGFVCDYIE